MKIIPALRYLAVATIGAIFASCGGNTKDTTTEIITIDEEIPSEVVEKPKDIKKMSVVADSMALWADDLDPKEALAVLTTFYRVHLDAQAQGNRRRDIQTMRKYLDVYDIVVGNHGNELRQLLAKVSEADTTLNLVSAVEEFRALLADYDSAHGQGAEFTEEKVDTASAIPVSETPGLEAIDPNTPGALTDDPLFRPAE